MLRKPLGEGMKPTDSGKESSRQSARPVQGERGLGVWGRRPVRWPGCQKDLGFYSEMVLNTGIMGSGLHLKSVTLAFFLGHRLRGQE